MRISAEWLGEYVSLPPLDKLEDTLLMAGLEIESREGERFELSATSNRGDWLCATGLAREIAAMTGARFRAPHPDVDEDGPAIDERVRVEIENPADCARYVARLVEGIQIAPSPDWMQKRLLECGVRPINNVVDVTNYVMLEWNQPLHAFDFDTLNQGQIGVRRGREGETLRLLDESEKALSPEMLLITSADSPVAVAGVMGGADTEVTDSTTNVLLESAHFTPNVVRRGAHRLGINTEASKRFERWVDPNGCKRAVDRAAQLLAVLGGGRVAAGAVDRYPAPVADAVVTLRPARCNAVLGLKIAPEMQHELLERLGFKVSSTGEELRVQIPTHRRDCEREIDLIEEIARLYGYDRMPTTLPGGTNTGAGRPLAGRLEDRARSACLRCGLTEVTTYSLSNDAAHERAGIEAQNAVRLRNPLSEDYTLLRESLLPSLLDVLRRNRGQRIRAFELGRVYSARGEGELADERRALGLALSDAPAAAHWQNSALPVDFWALKAIVENVLREFGAPTPVFSPAKHPTFHTGRCASIALGGEELGVLGEVHPAIAQTWELGGRAYIAQFDFNGLVRHISLSRSYQPFSRFPAVERDLALVVPQGLPAAHLLDAARRGAGTLLETVRLFDVYQGENLPEGTKSIALALRFRAHDRTLNESDVESAMNGVMREQNALGAQIRA